MSFKIITLKFFIVSNNYTNKHIKNFSSKYTIYIVSRLPKSKFTVLALFLPFFFSNIQFISFIILLAMKTSIIILLLTLSKLEICFFFLVKVLETDFDKGLN